MEIILHAHHAQVSESLRAQAEAAITRIAKRLHRVANAIVRFVGDGKTRRVEIVLRCARHRELVVHADARAFTLALSAAVHRLERQASRMRRSPRVPFNGDRTG